MKSRNGAGDSGDGMREYFLNPLLNLLLCPGGMLIPEARGLQFPSRPIERHRRAKLLLPRHALEAFEVFWGSGRRHGVALAVQIWIDNRKFPVLVGK